VELARPEPAAGAAVTGERVAPGAFSHGDGGAHLPAPTPCERVGNAARELGAVLPRLERGMVRDPKRAPAGFAPRRPNTSSRPPWETRTANALFGAEDAARRAEVRLTGYPSGRRPAVILAALPALAYGAELAATRLAAERLEKALLRSFIALGEAEAWAALPRVPGQPVHVCPWCRLPSLRVQPLAGRLRCIAPGCADQDGNRPEARIRLHEFYDGSSEWVLSWQDGSEGLPA
jgi:hypothetical protein